MQKALRNSFRYSLSGIHMYKSRCLLLMMFIFLAMPLTVSAGEEVMPGETETSEEKTEALPVSIGEGPGNTIRLGERLIPLNARSMDISGINLSECDIGSVFGKMPELKQVTMTDCGLTNEEYAALQDAYPGIRMIWEIQFSRRKLRTDAVAFSTFRGGALDQPFKDEDVYYLKYCRDMVGIDLGHNPVHDLSFLQYMHELKVLIMVDNSGLKDISMIRYVPKVTYLEVFVNSITDLSPIEGLKDMEDLNFSRNPVADVEAVKDFPKLKRMVFMETNVQADDIAELRSIYPKTKITTTGINSLAGDWREDPHYYAMRKLFKNNEENSTYHRDGRQQPEMYDR